MNAWGDMEETAELVRSRAQKTIAERCLIAQYAVTKVLAESANLMDSADEILRAIGESLKGELGMFWNVDEQAEPLVGVEAARISIGDRSGCVLAYGS